MWLWHFLGFDYGLPYGHVGAYNAWSGFLSDVGEITILGAAIAAWRKVSCHEPRCWRFGHYGVDGTPFKACHKHHPGIDGKPRKGHMTVAWNRAAASERVVPPAAATRKRTTVKGT